MPHVFTFALPINITARHIGRPWDQSDRVEIIDALSSDYLPEFRAFCSLIIANSIREAYTILETTMACEKLLSATCDVLYSSQHKTTLAITLITDDTTIFPMNGQTAEFLARHDIGIYPELICESLALCKFIRACMHVLIPEALTNLRGQSCYHGLDFLSYFSEELVYNYALVCSRLGEYAPIEWSHSYLDATGKNRSIMWFYTQNKYRNKSVPYNELFDKDF